MFPLFKRFILLSLTAILTSTVIARNNDTILYNEKDSLQDIEIKLLNQQIDAVKLLLRKNTNLQELIIDSLKIENDSQADQIVKINEESDLFSEKLHLAFKEIEMERVKLQESKRTFKTIYFITVPVLLLVSLSLFAILLILLTRHQNRINEKMSALRKYTYEGIEGVRADYLSEIKRRVRKIADKLKGKNKKVKKQKAKSNEEKEKGKK